MTGEEMERSLDLTLDGLIYHSCLMSARGISLTAPRAIGDCFASPNKLCLTIDADQIGTLR